MGNLIDWTNQAYYADNWTELLDCMTEFLIIFGDEALDLAVEQAQKGSRSNMVTKALREIGCRVTMADWSSLLPIGLDVEAHMRADAGEFLTDD